MLSREPNECLGRGPAVGASEVLEDARELRLGKSDLVLVAIASQIATPLPDGAAIAVPRCRCPYCGWYRASSSSRRRRQPAPETPGTWISRAVAPAPAGPPTVAA